MMRLAALAATALLATAATACALRLGGPGPETFRVVLATSTTAAAPREVGEWLRALDAHIAFLAAPGDSAWLDSTGTAAGLKSSGPARADGRALGLGILAWQALGDTTTSIAADSVILLVQDALYETRRGKSLDLMIVDVPAGAESRATTRALMTYIARDVMHDAIVMLALRAHDRPLADSIGTLLDPAFDGVARCEDQLDLLNGVQPGALRLYYSPAVRVRCDAVRGFDSPFPALLVRVELDG